MEVKKKIYQRNLFSIILAVAFFLIFFFVVIKFINQAKKANDELIAEHILQLNDIFNQINRTCKISGFSSKRDYIDFLTVKKFEGNMIGSMILLEPKKWDGPYLNNNLTIEGKEYQIVRAKKGYYIVPGEGVVLANGQIINKTIIFKSSTDIESLMQDPNYLFSISANKPLAAYIELAENPDRKQNDELIAEHIEKLSKIFQKINESCKITAFRHQKDNIDFLNVKSFVGPVVGCMNLLYPDKWQGPYLENNLTLDGKFYQIISTNKGYYIIPGDNVDLSNGQIINKTLIITPETDMDKLLYDPNALSSNGRPLAAKVPTYEDPYTALDKSDFLEEETETIA